MTHMVCIRATGTISNPWYQLPSASEEITPSCTLNLSTYNLNLFFNRDRIIFEFLDDSPFNYALQYYLIYRTFVNYNQIWPSDSSSIAGTFDEVETVPFKLERIVRKERDEIIGGRPIHFFRFDGKEHYIEITRDEIPHFLEVIKNDDTLYLALAYYLVGCDNQRYFLIEYYKAVEVIKNEFSNEKKFLEGLKPYGVKKKEYSEFKKICNSKPYDIGRHAPKKGSPLYTFDIRNMLINKESSDVFEPVTEFCRKVIDAYLGFLIDSG